MGKPLPGVAGCATAGERGAPGCPAESGGRNGCDERDCSERSSKPSLVASPALAVSPVLGVSRCAGAVSILCADGGRSVSAAGACVFGAGSADGSASGALSPPPRRRRSSKVTSSSSELECVFLSVTPSSGRSSSITLGLTSSSRASSLMRILLIRWRPGASTSCTRVSDISNLSYLRKRHFTPGCSVFSIVSDSFSASDFGAAAAASATAWGVSSVADSAAGASGTASSVTTSLGLSISYWP